MSSESSPKCPQCGAPLPANAPAGLCPNCLMALNLKTETVFTDDWPSAQPPLPPEQIAPHFPQLEILECLGRGGMGVVYKARQKTLNRLVALKLLAPERVNDAAFAERFTREAQALAALNHPSIVTIHDFGQAGGFYFLLMEFVDGVNLRQLLRARKLVPEEALAIVPALCDALQFAHERGIVHRDIKPENLLLDKAGRIKVADFGIAKMLGNGSGEALRGAGGIENATKTALGTPGYSAPEQMADPQHVDSRADIYSLGTVFYEMLTGELPGKRIEPPSRKVQIDVRLDAVVMRALEKAPELRWQTAAEFRTQMETVAATPPTVTPGFGIVRFETFMWGILPAAGCLLVACDMIPSIYAWVIIVIVLTYCGGTTYWLRRIMPVSGFPSPSPNEKKGTLKIMAWTKTQSAIAIGTIIILTAATTVVIIKELATAKPKPEPFHDPSTMVSPFTRVRFDTADSNVVTVAYAGSQYQLETVNGVPVADILDFCRNEYGNGPSGEGWAEKRFSEDLVVVLSKMGHPARSDNTVSLTLLDPQSGHEQTIDHAPMTNGNRNRIMDDRTKINDVLVPFAPPKK